MSLTLQEASKMYDIPLDTLLQYEKNGLLQNTESGSYAEDDFRKLGLVNFLLNAGFTQKEIRRYLELMDGNGTDEEQIRMLRKQRYELLEGIHEKQQILDKIDYMIWEKRKE
ncbi:MAG: MerR family transcriptional regulator [Muribaculaceae bacterium]|nr:MerR family transcriptional regulator [Muribaculaceae bacterium]